MFRHPNYYKELRKRNKLDQAISKEPATAGNQRSPGPGPKASSSKQQASSLKPQASSSKILEPRKSFTDPEPRCWTMINVLCG